MFCAAKNDCKPNFNNLTAKFEFWHARIVFYPTAAGFRFMSPRRGKPARVKPALHTRISLSCVFSVPRLQLLSFRRLPNLSTMVQKRFAFFSLSFSTKIRYFIRIGPYDFDTQQEEEFRKMSNRYRYRHRSGEIKWSKKERGERRKRERNSI